MMGVLRATMTAWLEAAGIENRRITSLREGRAEAAVAQPAAVFFPERETITRDGALAAKSRDPVTRELVMRRREFSRAVQTTVAIIADGRDQANTLMEAFLLQAKNGFMVNNNHVRLADIRVEWVESESVPDTRAVAEISLTFTGGIYADAAPARYATQAVVDLNTSGFTH